MPSKAWLVGYLYVEKRARELLERYAPDVLAADWGDKPITQSFAGRIYARKGFPKPYYSDQQRKRLCHHGRMYLIERVDAFIDSVIVPELEAGTNPFVNGRLEVLRHRD